MHFFWLNKYLSYSLSTYPLPVLYNVQNVNLYRKYICTESTFVCCTMKRHNWMSKKRDDFFKVFTSCEQSVQLLL